MPVVPDDGPPETAPHVLQTRRKTEHGHDLRRRSDVEPGLGRHAVGLPSESGDDVAERPVVDVEDTAPGHVVNADRQFVAVMDVIVDERRDEVVRSRDGMEVTGEMEVHLLHRNDL